MMAYAFVLIPILAYLPFFFIETWAAFKRIGKTKPSSDEYLHVTWEMTHTLLIVGVNYFIWLFASIIVEVGKAVYWGLIIAGALYIIRAILYIYIYYGAGATSKRHNGWADWAFAIIHPLIILCLLYVVAQATYTMLTSDYTINTQFLPWMYPGLVLMAAICAAPLLRIYKLKK